MASGLLYILDANIFPEAYKRYYAFDLCPGFWESIMHYGAQGVVATIDRVWDQLQEGDPLDQWKSEAPEPLVLSTDTDDILAAYAEVIRWAQRQPRLTDAAKAAFADDADAWLIACSRARGLTMITHEQPAPNSTHSVKIPDVCRALDITYQNTFDMLRELQVSYRWDCPMGC